MNGSNEEILVEFGLEFPQGLAIDRIAKNIYWTDSGSQRIEMSRCDGTHRKVLIWENLHSPMSIALDTEKGTMYWSSHGTNSESSKIESAKFDGTHRKIFVPDVGRANGLTMDQESG